MSKKKRDLVIKHLMRKTFKDLNKLPRVDTHCMEIKENNNTKILTAKTFINGEFVLEGCACVPLKSYRKCIQQTRECIDKIKSDNKILLLRSFPQIRHWEEKYAVRIRLAY